MAKALAVMMLGWFWYLARVSLVEYSATMISFFMTYQAGGILNWGFGVGMFHLLGW